MSDPDTENVTINVSVASTVPDEHEDVFESLTEQFESYSESAADGGIDDLSDDAFMQQLHDASRLLDEHGIPRNERAPYITAAIRVGAFRGMDRELSTVDHQIHMMFSL